MKTTLWIALLLPLLAHATPPKVAAGAAHTLAITKDSGLSAWGNDSYGQLGRNRVVIATTPQPLGNLTTAASSSLDAGHGHVAVVASDGTLWAWGYNGYGQLGDGSKIYSATPKQIGSGYATVSSGAFHTLALKTDGTLWAWGWNQAGQLGDGTTTDRLSPVPVSGLAGVTALAAGENFGFALKADGSLWAWGG